MNITFFTGAGMSEESGIPTFRTGENSIWNQYDPDIYCNIRSWPQHKEKMLEFMNMLRRNVLDCSPNQGHFLIAELEKKHNVNIVTTNVDDLHERAGSTNVIHMHGNILENCDLNKRHINYSTQDIKLGDTHPKSGEQLRHNIVMFGEMPYYIKEAKTAINKADILVVVGTSLNVYPAAGLVLYSSVEKKYYIDPSGLEIEGYETISKKASEGLEFLKYL